MPTAGLKDQVQILLFTPQANPWKGRFVSGGFSTGNCFWLSRLDRWLRYSQYNQPHLQQSDKLGRNRSNQSLAHQGYVLSECSTCVAAHSKHHSKNHLETTAAAVIAYPVHRQLSESKGHHSASRPLVQHHKLWRDLQQDSRIFNLECLGSVDSVLNADVYVLWRYHPVLPNGFRTQHDHLAAGPNY